MTALPSLKYISPKPIAPAYPDCLFMRAGLDSLGYERGKSDLRARGVHRSMIRKLRLLGLVVNH